MGAGMETINGDVQGGRIEEEERITEEVVRGGGFGRGMESITEGISDSRGIDRRLSSTEGIAKIILVRAKYFCYPEYCRKNHGRNRSSVQLRPSFDHPQALS